MLSSSELNYFSDKKALLFIAPLIIFLMVSTSSMCHLSWNFSNMVLFVDNNGGEIKHIIIIMLSSLQVMRKFSKLWIHSNMDCRGFFCLFFFLPTSQQTLFLQVTFHTINKSQRQFWGCVWKHKIKKPVWNDGWIWMNKIFCQASLREKKSVSNMMGHATQLKLVVSTVSCYVKRENCEHVCLCP